MYIRYERQLSTLNRENALVEAVGAGKRVESLCSYIYTCYAKTRIVTIKKCLLFRAFRSREAQLTRYLPHAFVADVKHSARQYDVQHRCKCRHVQTCKR